MNPLPDGKNTVGRGIFMHGKQLAARYFMLSFAVGFLVLAVAAMTAVLLIPPHMASADTLEGRVSGTYLPTNDDALNLFFVLEESGKDDLFALVRFDPLRGQIPVAVLPPGTLVGEGGDAVPLGALCRYAGPGSAAASVEKALGITLDRQVVLSGAALAQAVDLLGGVQYQLREPVELAGERLEAGNYQLSGNLTRELMRYPGYREGERERTAGAARLFSAVINQNSGIVLSGEADEMFRKLVSLASTDLSVADYQQRKPAAQFLAKLIGDAAFAVDVKGEDIPAYGAFVLSDTSREQLRGIYSPA